MSCVAHVGHLGKGSTLMKRSLRRVLTGGVALCASMSLVGCGGFFVNPGSTSTTSGTGSTSDDYVYVANATTNTLAGFAVGTGTLTAVTDSPYALSFSPQSLAVNPANTLLYVGGTSLVYVFSIGSGGELSVLNNGSPVAICDAVSMDISPDGNWLFVLDGNGVAIDQYEINSSTGVLTQATGATYSITSATVVPRSLKVAPDGDYVFAALGTAGELVFSLSESTGVLSEVQMLSAPSSTTSDNALAVSAESNYLYIARSGTDGGVAAYSIASNTGALSLVSGSPFAAGTQPYALALNDAGTDLYVANRGDGTISAYTVGSSGGLTAVSGSPYTAGSSVGGLAADRSGDYLLAIANGGSPDLAMYSFDTTTAGKLDLTASTTTGTDPTGAVAIAVTH